MAAKKSSKKAPPNYDYTASTRVARHREALAEAGGARVEAKLDAQEIKKLDAQVRKDGSSRNAVIKHLVGQLPDPKD